MKRPYPSTNVTNLPGGGRLSRRTYFTSPASLPSLHSWYDAADTATITASAGRVSQWNDKSGNNYHATQATSTYQPTTGSLTLNGKNVLSGASASAGNGARMIANASVTSNSLTAFVIASKTGAGGAGNVYDRYLSLWPSSNLTGYDYNSTDGFLACYSTQTQLSVAAPNTYAYRESLGITAQGITYGSANIEIVVLDGANVSLTHNGVTSTGTTSATSLNSDRQGLMSNGVGAGNDSSLYGYIAEHILYTRVLSSVDIARVTAYLKAKWGLR